MKELIRRLRSHPHLSRSVRLELALRLEKLERLEAAVQQIADGWVRPGTAAWELQQIARRAL